MATAVGYDDIFLSHLTGRHPERPARLTAMVDSLKHSGLWDRLVPITERPEPDGPIRRIHSDGYIDRLASACRDGLPFIDTPDSAICRDSFNVARDAVSVGLGACDMVMDGRADNAICLLRPPGHHAESDRSMGFCLFNNIAVACRYLQDRGDIKKVLICDWDVHHGNGTQHSFERDDTVFYGSLHQHPATLFPGTGWPDEFGIGPGRGYNLNLPLSPGAGDDDWLDMFETNLLPVANEFAPDFVLVSVGFDGHTAEAIAQLNLTERSYQVMATKIKQLAERHCNGRMVCFLEGGYELDVLGRCLVEHVNILMQQ